jgi:hypothetical protein
MDAPRNGAATERRADEVVAGGTRAWCAGAGGCKGDGASTQSQWKTGNAAARAGVANGTGLAEAECDV